mgnify:CR=1 FL=1
MLPLKKNELLKHIFLTIFLCLFLWVEASSQTLFCDPRRKNEVVESKTKPKLAVEFEKIIEFKITARKLELRKGDVLKLFYAFYNKGNSSIWIRNLPEINISIRSRFTSSLFAPSPIDYTAVANQNYEVHELEYFIGCENIESYWRRYSSDRKTNFDKGFFDNISNECIDVKSNEKIYISLALSNNYVVVSPKKRNKNDDVYPQFPTAVGNIKSNVLEISILPN